MDEFKTYVLIKGCIILALCLGIAIALVTMVIENGKTEREKLRIEATCSIK